MKTIIHMQGDTSLWGVQSDMTQEQIDAMRDDGIDVGIVGNVVPEWIVNVGLMRPYCFIQDCWNFKNPFQ